MHLEVVVLALLLGLEVEAGEAAQVLAAHGLVDGGAAADALAVVVRHVGPPVRLLLHVAQNHVLNRRRQPRHLPRDVCLPAATTNTAPSMPCMDRSGTVIHSLHTLMQTTWSNNMCVPK